MVGLQFVIDQESAERDLKGGDNNLSFRIALLIKIIIKKGD